MGGPEFTTHAEDQFTGSHGEGGLDKENVTMTAAAGTSTSDGFSNTGTDMYLVNATFVVTDPPSSYDPDRELFAITCNDYGPDDNQTKLYVSAQMSSCSAEPWFPGYPMPDGGTLDFTIYNYSTDPIDVYASAQYMEGTGYK